MNRCEITETTLNDYFDKRLPEGEAREMARHIAGCDACRTALEDLEALRDMVRQLPVGMEPARDLWPEIAGKLADRSSRFGGETRLGRRFAGFATAAAAVCLVAGLGLFAIFHGNTPVRNESSIETFSTSQSFDDVTDADVETAEEAYRDAAKVLLAELDVRKTVLTPQAWKVLHINLNITDNAIREIKAALEQEPNNLELAHRLKRTYDKQVRLMQHVRDLSIAIQDTGTLAL